MQRDRPFSPSRGRLVAALAILLIGVGGQFVLARQVARLRSPASECLARPLAEFPDRIGPWVGADLAINPKIVSDIKIDDYLQRVYTDPSGERLVLWMSFSTRSTDQYHYPTVCMQGAGWREDESQRARLAADSPGAATMHRLWFAKPERAQLVYYWYYLIGEDGVDRWMRQFSQASRAFLRGRRNASLTVEVFSQSQPPDAALLDEFARQVAERLREVVPEGSEMACELGANY